MGEYYDPDGAPIAMLEWAELFERRAENMAQESWWRKHTEIDDDVSVSTVWLGMNHAWCGGPPLIWETMVFGGDYNEHQWRYPTRQTAFDDHERIVKALREGLDPEAAS